MGRLRGLIIFLGGVVLMVMGLGMYRAPHLDWEGFIEAWSLLFSDIARLIDDPFAVLGVVVLIIGFLVVVNGLRRVVRE